jgi:hypothetical protein
MQPHGLDIHELVDVASPAGTALLGWGAITLRGRLRLTA